MQVRHLTAALALTCSILIPAHAAQRRQLGPHVHGITTVDIAMDDDALEIDVSAPGDNMLGFEHAPHTPAEHAALDHVLADLGHPARWLEPDPDGACVLSSTAVHPHGYADSAVANTGAHADIDASYRYRCIDSSKLHYVAVHLADRYPGTHEVVVNLALPTQQGRQVLQGDDVTVHLDH